MRGQTVVLAVGALLLLRGSSCIQVERPYAAPTAAEVVAAIQARGQKVRSIRAETRMSHRTDQGKVKATVRLMVQRGGKLRFDAVTPFDTPLATLVSDGESFTLVDAKQNRHFHGPASPCNIARLLQVALAPDDVLTVLGGSTPLIQHESATLAWDSRGNAEVLTLKGKHLTQTVRLDGTDRRWDLLRSEIRDHKGKTLLRIAGDAYRKVGGLRVPRRVSVDQPERKAELELTFKQQEINLTLPPAAFQLLKPDGLPSQRVECTTVLKP